MFYISLSFKGDHMNITIEDINLYIPKEVTDRLPRKKFHAGEIILGTEDKHILFILDGTGHFMRYQNNKKVIYPFIYKSNTVAGFNILFSTKGYNWEFLSTTKGEAIIFTEEIIQKYIYQNPDCFKFLVENTIRAVETGINSFHILAHGGAKACLAFLFIEGAEKDHFTFLRYENFAEALGISKSMLYRITKSLIEEKLIKKERKTIVILDSEGLKDLYREYLYF